MDVTTIAAIGFAVAAGTAVAFQLAMALGAPWGAYTMGGRFPGRFPPAMRVGAVIQGLVIALIGAVVLARAELVLPSWAQASTWAVWIVVAFSGLSLVLNTITPSAPERRVWVPVTLVLLACSITVALTGDRVGS